jgi:hypothetical protein
MAPNWSIPPPDHAGEFNMYAALFSLGAALIACAGMAAFGSSAATAGGFFIAALAVGARVDVMRARERAAVK